MEHRTCSQRSTTLIKHSNSNRTAVATQRTHQTRLTRNSFAAVINRRSRRCWSSAGSFTLSRYTSDSSTGRTRAIKRCFRMRSVSLRTRTRGTRRSVGNWIPNRGKLFARDSILPYSVSHFNIYVAHCATRLASDSLPRCNNESEIHSGCSSNTLKILPFYCAIAVEGVEISEGSLLL